ncbi:serpin family protein [Pacificimonas flava]|uniref:serpin family protein n=1 Tax=Pacificimonas flava TaxID=1234595 RepID=UPI00098F8EF5|nr:serpin family protein [Pacificimonas flava]MBB5281828.1 serine protease inhibitor [Pacificimonas flava]
MELSSRVPSATTETLDFASQPNKALTAISAWADKATEGLVPQVVDRTGLNHDAGAYLVKATFFKTNWSTAFRVERTSRSC